MLPSVRSFPTSSGVPGGHGERVVICGNCKATIPVAANALRVTCPHCNRTVETTVVPSVQQR